MTELGSNRLLDIAILQLSIFVLSLAMLVAKMASSLNMLSANFAFLYLLEVGIIGIYALIWQQIIKKFEISVAYANKGTLILWTFLWAGLFFHETIALKNILGALLIITGIVMVFRDAK